MVNLLQRYDGLSDADAVEAAEHIAVANDVILATAVVPANIQEHPATPASLERVEDHGQLTTLDIDRGYLASEVVATLHHDGVRINSKPWVPTNKGLFTKLDFEIDMKRRLVTCPNGKTARALESGKATFSVEDCQRCKLRPSCTTSSRRSIAVHPNESMLIQLRRRKATRRGRAEPRKRVVVERRLARVSMVQGNKARYLQEVARLRAA